MKITAPDGKSRLTDTLDYESIIALSKEFPSKKANRLIEWFSFSDESIDGKSKIKVYALFESNFNDSIEVGTTKGLQQIHAYLFGGLYELAGQLRTKSISKGGFRFTPGPYLKTHLSKIDEMPDDSIKEIVDKYCAMNITHPFMEGNGRATRVWLDLLLKKRLQCCVDWSKISKNNIMNAMIISTVDSSELLKLINNAKTNEIHSREIFMKGIDYSYYYEENLNIEID